MMMIIHSRKLKRKIVFSRPGRSYLYVDTTGIGTRPGTLGAQICEGGGFRGNTLAYSGDDQEVFEKICRRWYRAFLRSMNE